MRIQRTSRPGFTITEMMVATALILFLMAIISQAFGAATRTFNELRVVGQMQERLRTSSSIIRRDLTAEHFDGPYIPGRSGPRLSDQRLDLAGWVPPPKGYFEIRYLNNVNPIYFEPLAGPQPDGEGLYSTRSDDTHVLRFTVKLPELAASELFCAAAPPEIANNTSANAFPDGRGAMYSRWAEIQYFLASNGDSTPGGIPLYSLRRRVRLLAPTGTNIVMPQASVAQLANYPDIALQLLGAGPVANTAIVRVLGPEDVTDPSRRFSGAYGQISASPAAPTGTGDDILLTDVLSFEVKAAWSRNAAFNNYDVANPQTFGSFGSSPSSTPLYYPTIPNVTSNSDAPYDLLPRATLNMVGQRRFDTWYRHPQSDGVDWDRALPNNGGFLTPGVVQPPLRINVRSIQIKIRVYDSKAEKARQVTIAQEL